MARPRSALSTFILSLPRDLPIDDVIAKAKAKGMKASANNIYRVRRMAGAKVAKKTLAAPAAPPSKAAAPVAAASTQNKAEFVRSLSSLTPREIVARAKTAGVKLDVGYVYNVRGKSKASTKKRGRPTTKSTNGATTPATTSHGSSSNEVTFRKLVYELGVGRAKSLLGDVEAKLSALIAGR